MRTRTNSIDRHVTLRCRQRLSEDFLESLAQGASNEGSFVEIDPVVQILLRKVCDFFLSDGAYTNNNNRLSRDIAMSSGVQ